MRILGGLLSALVAVFIAGSAMAADLPTLVKNLVTGGVSERDEAIIALAGSGEERAESILRALGAGNLYVRTSDSVAVIGKTEGKQVVLTDAITGKDAGTVAEDALERVRVNNRLRGKIDAVMGSLTLMNPSARVRQRAADELFKRRDPGALPA
ncbi:MAG: urea ABC transporter permease subunit UrtB, partial [Acidimicrobiia bacterium]